MFGLGILETQQIIVCITLVIVLLGLCYIVGDAVAFFKTKNEKMKLEIAETKLEEVQIRLKAKRQELEESNYRVESYKGITEHFRKENEKLKNMNKMQKVALEEFQRG